MLIPPSIADHPPSDKLLWCVIACNGPQTKQELVNETAVHQATVYRALDRLRDEGVIQRESADDLRQDRYHSTASVPKQS